MDKYYVNKNAQNNGDHEVHKEDCSYMPLEPNREYLGMFYDCSSAVNEAKVRGYNTADGCYYCSYTCHTS